MSLGQRVREARRQRGWTREMLAVYAGVSATTVARIERGGYQPRVWTVIALATALELDAQELAAEAGLEVWMPRGKWD